MASLSGLLIILCDIFPLSMTRDVVAIEGFVKYNGSVFIKNCLVNQHGKQTLGWELGLERKTMFLKSILRKGRIPNICSKKFQD